MQHKQSLKWNRFFVFRFRSDWVHSRLKGQCHEIFCFWFFSSISSVSPSPRVSHLDRLEFFRQFGDIHRSRLSTGVVDTGGKWKNLQSKKLIILLGHFWIVEVTHIYIFAFKFTLRYLQPDITPLFATGVVDTGGKPWAANISANFRKNSKRP
jgi:hypothetical protein